MMKLKDLITEITESTFRVTFDIEDAKLGRYTTDVEAKDKKEAEKVACYCSYPYVYCPKCKHNPIPGEM